jgi:iron complex outermembrane receptor protein
MYSQELNFASEKFGPASFVAGLYYYYDNNRFAANHVESSLNPATTFIFISENPQLAYAAFAEVNFDITDRLKLILGGRYSTERRANKGKSSVGVEPSETGPYTLGPVVHFDSFTPRVSAKYDITDRTNVYFTFSKGFKSGGTQGTAFLTPPALWSTVVYRPEKIAAYEIGLKSNELRNLSFDLAAYWYDYRDLQVQVQDPTGLALTQNAATAKIYGLDADAVWRATEELTITGGLSLLHARYGDFPNAVVLRPTPPPPVQLHGNSNVVVDASGNYMPRAPDYSFTLNGNYRKPVELGTVEANLSLFYTGRVYYDSDERIYQPAYALINGSLAFEPRDSRTRVEVWVKNLANKDYIASTFIQAVSDVVGYAPPRTFGLSLTYSF